MSGQDITHLVTDNEIDGGNHRLRLWGEGNSLSWYSWLNFAAPHLYSVTNLFQVLSLYLYRHKAVKQNKTFIKICVEYHVHQRFKLCCV